MRTVLGHKFRPFTDADWRCWGGAEPGSLICEPSYDCTLIFDPSTGVVSEMVITETDTYQRDWTSAVVLGEPTEWPEETQTIGFQE